MSYYRNKREERERLVNECLDIVSNLRNYFMMEEATNGGSLGEVEDLDELKFKLLRMI